MVARYVEFGGHKACENDSASNPNNQIWRWLRLFGHYNQLKPVLMQYNATELNQQNQFS